ncbi:MAG: serine/threonine-protein kinase, partial [Gemmataceae bacterium]
QRRLLQLSDPTGLLACLGSSEEGEELPSPPFFQALLQQVEEATARDQAGLNAEVWLDRLGSQIGLESLSEIGRGGTAIVYKAWQPAQSRWVALKVVPLSRLQGVGLDRQRRGVESLMEIRHPAIVRVEEVGRMEDWVYGVQEFVEGGDLRQWLRNGQIGDWRQTAQLLARIAEAVQVVHDHGIIHRDLKSSNILMTLSGQPKLADFGMAKSVSDPREFTTCGDMLGTPAYMAPEQASGRPQASSFATDIYALGVIAYELLTGRTPFRGSTSFDTLYQVVHVPPIAPRRWNRAIPEPLERLCLLCLSKTPEQRPLTAFSVAHALHQWLDGDSNSAPAMELASASAPLAPIGATVSPAVRTEVLPPWWTDRLLVGLVLGLLIGIALGWSLSGRFVRHPKSGTIFVGMLGR